MRRYCIKCRSGRIEYFDIISETDDELLIRLYRITDGSEKIIEETMSHDLFNMCTKTGYIYELEMDTAVVA